MSISDELTERVKAAYAEFKSKVSEEKHDEVMAMLEKIHYAALSAIDGSNEKILGSEFAHALSVLDKIPPGSKKLPTTETELKTRLIPDGELLGIGKWEILDPGWVEAFEQWLLHLEDKAPFNTSPQTIPIADHASFAIAGDWGTGDWKENAPSTKVGKQIEKLAADYTIHLGDVYYAGTDEQEINNLVESWPMGSKGGFSLNSNHEMYNGALSYYHQALVNKFTEQKGCSYFALENSDWLIVGLDTAYNADPMDLYLKGNLDDGQISWLKTLSKNKRIMMLSHHEGYDIKGETKTQVYKQVIEGLGQEPHMWYWGHAHNAIVYNPKGSFYGRCIGHGAIPYGNATELEGNSQVAWYETESAQDPAIPLRVLNGVARVVLEGGDISEQFFDENGNVRFYCQPALSI